MMHTYMHWGRWGSRAHRWGSRVLTEVGWLQDRSGKRLLQPRDTLTSKVDMKLLWAAKGWICRKLEGGRSVWKGWFTLFCVANSNVALRFWTTLYCRCSEPAPAAPELFGTGTGWSWSVASKCLFFGAGGVWNLCAAHPESVLRGQCSVL